MKQPIERLSHDTKLIYVCKMPYTVNQEPKNPKNFQSVLRLHLQMQAHTQKMCETSSSSFDAPVFTFLKWDEVDKS